MIASLNIRYMYLERLATPRLMRLLEQFPAVVVAGARQVGKSTFIEHVMADKAEFVVFDPVIDVENARQDPELFLDNHRTPLVLDEIQYAPEVVPALKRRIDQNRTPGQYLLTGSQQWEVFKALAESLAGRVVFLDLEGFCLAEIEKRIEGATWVERWLDDPDSFLASRSPRLPAEKTLYERLWQGALPETESLARDVLPDFHAAYQRTYIERDARQLGNVSDWQQFGRFFRLAAALTAQEVNQSQFGRDIGVTPQTARRWLDVLVATFQWHEVPAFFRNTVKRISRRPKGYLADTGLACAAMRISSPQALADHPALGAIFETAIVGEIRRLISVLSPKPALHHWRSHGGAEVDLILERDGVIYPIEVKIKSRPTRGDARGIAALRATHPELRISRGLVVSASAEMTPLTRDDHAIPWDLAPAL